MTNTIPAPMTHGEVLLSARVLDGATRGLKIRWMQDIDDPAAIAPVPSRGGNVMHGVLRRVVDAPGSVLDARPGTDIRDQFVHVSATFEHWLPVSAVMNGVHQSTVYIEA
ncbi:hypothetical protein B7435_16740 [Mycolicibacterium peregrinum]|uniref:Uncharacterized protein n=1 Tax=Mycolicibacterium alvei TaxID=67081 RepID=A0A6N4V1B1_9MYCO|nr:MULTISPECIES: hypothetical protein [Mycolicibacterium]MCV7003563.1 hypothetical protein [Mycolicibacterium alvei]OWM01211.1 hypothetical protein B7435_16740 [Mycolicibacterium peregrinum]BBX30479.1 hypothetical protein MALV_56040 [Mycolicibacterium alvei]